jgi:hypothetical protein
VRDIDQMLELMKELEESGLDLKVESRPRKVKIRISSSREELRRLKYKLGKIKQ